MRKNKLLSLTLVLILSVSLLVGCAAPVESMSQLSGSLPLVGEVVQLANRMVFSQKPVVDQSAVILCEICGDDDCDNGKYCDDAHELQENLREEQSESITKSAEPKAAAKPTEPTTYRKPEPVLCAVCGDDDCDDGKYCDDAHEKAENLQEAEREKNGAPCEICGERDCDDGIYCDDTEENRKNRKEEKQPAPTEPKATEPAVPKETKPAPKLCEICGDDDCDDGKYCDDADEKAENLREQENRKNGTPCQVCGEYDCDDSAYCDDWDNHDDWDAHDDHRHGRHHDD